MSSHFTGLIISTPSLRVRWPTTAPRPSSAAHASSGSRCSSASTRAKPPFAPSSTPYCIVVSRSSVVAKRIACVSFVRSPRSSNSSVCRWFWNVCTRRSGASTSRNSPSTTPWAVRKRYVPPGWTSISSTTVPSPHHSGISFGSVQTEKTCVRGASKIRSTRISSSFGVVTVVSFISAHRFLHERADLRLVGSGQLRQREGDRPHGAFVELRAVVEAEHRVPLLELPRVAEEADDLAVLGIGGHPVPRFRREIWSRGLDELMEPLSDGAVLRRHRGDRGAHGAFPIRLVLQLSGARSHRGLFLGCESFFLVGALGLQLAFLHSGVHRAPFVRSITCAKRSSRFSHVLMPSKASGTSLHLRARPTFSVATRFASSSNR